MPLQVGQEITASIAIVNALGAPTDPPNVYAFTRAPGGSTTTEGTRLMTVARTGTGAYNATFTPGVAGTWALWFSDTLTPITNPTANNLYEPASFIVFPAS